MIDPLRDHAINLIRRERDQGHFETAGDAALFVDAIIGTLLYRGTIGEPLPTEQQLAALGAALLRPIPSHDDDRDPQRGPASH